MVFAQLMFFVFGLIVLVNASDYFVKYSARIAEKLGVSEFIIGLTLVALGTSVPELASSLVASIENAPGIVIGNVIGSNIVNICLIIGISSLFISMKTHERMLKRDGYIMLFATLLLSVFILNLTISRIEGIIFLILYCAYILFLIESKPKNDIFHFREFIRYFFSFRYLQTINGIISNYTTKPTGKPRKSIQPGVFEDLAILTIAAFGVAFGAKFFIENAVYFAELLNINSTIIGISLVAIGTSLPELSVSISAAKKGYGNIVVGNIIGSNIANIFLVLGASSIVRPIIVAKSSLSFTIPFLILMSVLLLLFIKSKWEIKRIEGITFLLLYVFFILVLFLNNSIFT